MLIENVQELVNERWLYPIGWSFDGTQIWAFEEQTGSIVMIPGTGGSARTVFEDSSPSPKKIGPISPVSEEV